MARHFTKPDTTDLAEAWKESSEAHRGSGGGAGGSIQLIMNKIQGDGVLSVKGGNGKDGGGGGSGGRASINFLQSYLEESYPDLSHDWYGTLDLDGGRAAPYL
jgi:hypothetical protein